MGMPDVDVLLSSLKVAKDMAKGFMSLKQEAERQQLVIDLQGQILQAQDAASRTGSAQREIQEEVDRLLRRVDELTNQKAIVATMTRKNGNYYIPRENEPCCTRCVEVDVKIVHLSRLPKLELRRPVWACLSASVNTYLGTATSPRRLPAQDLRIALRLLNS